MADQEHGPLVIFQQLFKQFERIDVEVVGRFVEHQHVCRLGEQACQQQPVAFTTGQRLDRRARTLRREQEVVQVRHDMLALAIDLDPIAARRNGIGQARLFIQLRTHLVEVGDLQLGTLADGAAVGLVFTEDQLEQRRLASAIQSDQTDLIATQNRCTEILDDHLLAKGLVDGNQLGHDFAGAIAGRHVELDLPLLVAPYRARHAQGFETPDPAFVTGTTCLDTLADPDLFLRQELVEFCVFHFLDFELFGLAHLIRAEVTGKRQQLAAVEFDDAGRDIVQETTIVGDEQYAALVVAQQAFQP